MHFSKFINKIEQTLLEAEICNKNVCFNHTIYETKDGIFIDYNKTEFKSLEEAKEHLKQQNLNKNIQLQIQNELYENITPNKIVDIIQHHHNIRITDTLIESYIDLASSKTFSVDPVIHDLRKYNSLIKEHLDYKLDDGTVVVISENTQQLLNNIFDNHPDIIEYMRENKENFLNVVNQLED